MNLWKTKRAGTAYSRKVNFIEEEGCCVFYQQGFWETLVILSRKWQKSSLEVMNVNMKVCTTAHVVASTTCLQTAETLIVRDNRAEMLDKLCNKWQKITNRTSNFQVSANKIYFMSNLGNNLCVYKTRVYWILKKAGNGYLQMFFITVHQVSVIVTFILAKLLICH